MNSLDLEFMKFVGGWSVNWPFLDGFVKWAAATSFLKGEILVPVLWWAWFKTDEPDSKHRAHLLATLLGSYVAMFVARVMAIGLPFRQRPLHNPELEALSYYSPIGHEEWSSFPSDHAVLFVALAVGILFISRRVGCVALVYVGACVCFPRIYAGLHYPSDILGGALIGAGFAIAANRCLVSTSPVKSVMDWADKKPSLFYPLFFWVTYQVTTLFRSPRAIGEMILKYI